MEWHRSNRACLTHYCVQISPSLLITQSTNLLHLGHCNVSYLLAIADIGIVCASHAFRQEKIHRVYSARLARIQTSLLHLQVNAGRLKHQRCKPAAL